ncbi:MAG: LuxR family transcriptional regulator [Neobacillus sp.]
MDKKLSNIQQREEEFLIGREQELHRYTQFLSGQGSSQKLIWSIFGTGGMGKTTLLDAFRRRSIRENAIFVVVDSREFVHTPEQINRYLLQLLDYSNFMNNPTSNDLLERIRVLADQKYLTLAFDNYDEMGDLDGWLRENLFQWLPENVLTVLAGRRALQGTWLLSPAWRERVESISLAGLSELQSNEYLIKCGISEPDTHKKIWIKTKGHPLALSLATADSWSNYDLLEVDDGEEWFPLLVEQWLREVPDENLRDWVEIVSVLRYFDRESINFVSSGKEISADEFSKLCRFSFVRKTARGWTLHDLMRDALSKLILEHTPSKYRELVARCAELYVERIMQAPRDGSSVWELRECFAYIGDASIRWIVAPTEHERYVWEELSEQNLAEAERYLQHRYELAMSNTSKDILFLDVIKSKDLSLKELLGLSRRIVKLMRNQKGAVVGIAVIYPLNVSTISYMKKDPLASTYINSLSSKDYEELLVPLTSQGGWYIRLIDVSEPMNPLMSIEAVALIFSMMVSNGVIIAAPPPDPMTLEAHHSLGFQELPGAYHTYYDGVTSTPTFYLDTRGEKLKQLFEDLFKRTGIPIKGASVSEEEQSPANKIEEVIKDLTQREQEAVRLVVKGLSNAEIGKKLFVSEVTIKKHLSSAYQKLRIRNRSDLLRLLL